MGFKLAAILCLSFALVAKAQIGTAIANDLNAKENQLNCLLGKPNCGSPPPPGTTTPPSSSPPTGTPPTGTPPTGTPPTEAPVPAPAPGPAGPTGTAVAVISLSFPDTFILSDADRQRLVDLIQQELGPDAIVEVEVTGGRKLLQITTITLVFTEVTDCATVGLRLQAFIPGRFVSLAISIGIPMQSASLNTFACTFPGRPPYTLLNPPAVAPSQPPTPGMASPPGAMTPDSGR